MPRALIIGGSLGGLLAANLLHMMRECSMRLRDMPELIELVRAHAAPAADDPRTL